MAIELQSNEHVVMLCRRHWIYLYPLVVGLLLLLVVPVVVLLVVLDRTDASGLARTAGYVLAAAWAIFWGVRAYLVWYQYHNDQWIITNQRLIDYHRRHWFNQEISSADLVDVQDTSVERNGVLRTLMNFGDLLCQTAGQQLNFRMSGIPDPARVLTTLDSARDEARRTAHA